MLNDQPAKDDPLGRRPFAVSIARVISTQSDHAPQVIAIDGAWGEGKTTVFGFLEESLKEQDLKVMAFNAWRYQDEESMVRGFIIGLGETLGCNLLNKRDQWVEWVQKKVDWVKAGDDALGSGKLGGFLEFGTKRLRPTLELLTDRLKGELNSQAQRVTVLVDDPDRLDAEQLLGLFRLVKLTANFEWLTFVLAMDCAAVARTVGRRFGGKIEGRRFLEKIVQVPLRLPAVPHQRMLDFTLNLVQQVISDLKVGVTDDEARRFRSSFDSGLMPFISTPRLAKQYANVLRFALGFSADEVNAVDVMLLEALRLMLPDIFERLFQEVAPVTNKLLDDIYLDQLRSDKTASLESARFRVLPKDEVLGSKRALTDLLTSLFPRTFSGIIVSDEVYRQWDAAKRVACEDYMWRYLHCAVPDYDVPDAEVEELLRVAECDDNEATEMLVGNIIQPKRAKLGVGKLRRVEHRLTQRQRRNLALAVAGCSEILPWYDHAWQFEFPFGQAAIAVSHFIRDFVPMESREQLAAEVMTRSKSLLWVDELFSWLPHLREDKQMDEDQRRLAFDRKASENLGAMLAERVMIELESTSGNPPLEILRKYWLCAKYGQKDRLRGWIRGGSDRAHR